jgi:hypothetical protein
MTGASGKQVFRRRVNKKSASNNLNGKEVTITYGAKQTLQDRYYATIPKPMKGATVKYIDNYYIASNSTATISYFAQSNPSQGVAQSQRTGDTIWLREMEVKASFIQSNSDVYSHCRLFFFIWKQNSASTVPGQGSILENVSTYSVYSPLNFEGRAYYRVVYDFLVPLAGTATNPTAISCVDKSDVIPLLDTRVDFNSSAITGTGLLYVGWYSDSAAVPYPLQSLVTRTWYLDAD